MTLDLRTGSPKVVFSFVRETVRESVIQVEETLEDEILEDRTSFISEFKNLMRGQSFENERGCDEIMQ